VTVAVERDIFGARRIELALLIAEALSARISDPLCSVERAAGGSVEFVVPEEARRLCAAGAGGERDESDA